MYLSELRIENFRIFGAGDKALVLPLQSGLNAIVGENDSGKTAIVDAIRLILGTRDQEYYRVEESDFHHPAGSHSRTTEIRLVGRFDDLSDDETGSFSEYLSHEDIQGVRKPVLFVHWHATSVIRRKSSRRFFDVEIRCGRNGDGPLFDAQARSLLASTYLRPLRDAERELAAGRGSRLSQILQHTSEVRDHGVPFNPSEPLPNDLASLSILGIADLTESLLEKHPGIDKACKRLNDNYLNKLSFAGDQLSGVVSVGGTATDSDLRLRLVLEKLELELCDPQTADPPPARGLGSNNLLFMACEMLLLGAEEEGFPILLVEEPEAHLHPQRQLRLMRFLQERCTKSSVNAKPIQVIVTTHSPNLASAIDVNKLILLSNAKAFPLASGRTNLSQSDYRFLQRFLDSTKANLFFARGVLIVEGDAEAILLPTIAKLINRDLTEFGVSIVNVGGIGLHRFAKIFQRNEPHVDGQVNTPVACITDVDVMPDCAPEILGKIKAGEDWPEKGKRRWRAIRDFEDDSLTKHRDDIRARASGQCVETFVADHWTLEFDLARGRFAKTLWTSIQMAKSDDDICRGKVTTESVAETAGISWKSEFPDDMSEDEKATRIYAAIVNDSKVSKVTTAQYFCEQLDLLIEKRQPTEAQLRAAFPQYLVHAIDFVTIGQNAKDHGKASQS